MIKCEKTVAKGIRLGRAIKGLAYEIVTIPDAWRNSNIYAGDWCIAYENQGLVTLKGEKITSDNPEFTIKPVNLVVRLAE